jgi:hypothetical protein
MPGKQLKKPQLLSPVQNKPTPPSTLPKKTQEHISSPTNFGCRHNKAQKKTQEHISSPTNFGCRHNKAQNSTS